MSLQTSLKAFLSADAGVSALVGSRIYPLVIPDQVYDAATLRPCLVYAIQSVDRTKTFCGTVALQRVTVSVDCYAKVYVDAHALATAVETALLDFVGPMGDVTISDIASENKFDLTDLEPGLFRVALSFVVWYAE